MDKYDYIARNLQPIPCKNFFPGFYMRHLPNARLLTVSHFGENIGKQARCRISKLVSWF